jgi:phosphatidylglycerol:prolipoprotein diacylglycerol transferase
MHPVLFKINFFGNELIAGTYGLFIIIGALASYAASRFYSKTDEFMIREINALFLIIFSASIAGAVLAGKIYSIFDIIPGESGKAILISWGGIFSAIFGLLLISRLWKFSFLTMADRFSPGFFLAMGFGRIGCFFAGCCYGVPSGWGLLFTDPLAPAAQFACRIAPVQMIEAVILFGSGTILFLAKRRFKIDGLLFACAMLIYGSQRFIIEFWRGDPRLFVYGLSDGQISSLVFVLIGFAISAAVIKKI